MPELPDVETYRRYFDATALHQVIRQVRVPGPELLVETSPQGLGRALHGARFTQTERHGKYLFALLDSGSCLVLHFGMSGNLSYSKSVKSPPQYTQLEIDFDSNYRLAYRCPRKLGRIALTGSPDDWIRDRDLGPDALRISEEEFLGRSQKRHGQVKPWLMDQHQVAGIGNYYSDEILFQSRIHPARSLDDLDESNRKRVFRAMRTVLKQAIDCDAEPAALPQSYLLPHRHQDGQCPRCGRDLETQAVGGRTAWYCPGCQPG
ncbi:MULTISPECIES: Fpg/Nei family DNA glycosylase [Microbulbifer]|uniref:Fpg/Nei family DNA glycosylase n=1 Tax=Microbulbifer TaxID=48073 RepID=UPI001E4016BA|nr:MULTISPECIES: DNA-formamidopyrimidine glycosylase family protein [Microbulbifer]UHQ56105.1 zf-TFIIB domain-containing protein [Microbulbifer sp. YPW16]